MVSYPCPKCYVIFNKKSNFDRHINKKYDCSTKNNITDNKLINNLEEIQNIPNIPNNPNQIQNIPVENKNEQLCCGFCSNTYSTKSNLNKHLKICKIKKENENEKENIFKLLLEKDKENKNKINELEKQNKILMDKIDKLINLKSSKIINNTQNNTINNTQNNTQNNYMIVNFGKEDLTIIDKHQFIDRLVKSNLSGVKIPDEILKIIHFNPQYPQLSNIYISDINREKCMVYEDGEWKLSSVDNIPQIMDKIYLFTTDQINKLREKNPNNKRLNDRLGTIEKYNNMIDEDYIQDLRDDDDYNDKKPMIKRAEEFKKHTYNTLKKTLYNEGKKIKKILITANNNKL